jgi:hypothetical protein
LGTTRCAQKEALTNSPGPKTCAVFLNEMKIDKLTIANVRGRLKMKKFYFGPRLFVISEIFSWCSLDCGQRADPAQGLLAVAFAGSVRIAPKFAALRRASSRVNDF